MVCWASFQVLYSQFVTLLDAKKVKAARLESGTGRLYFELQSNSQLSSTASAGPSTSTSGQPAAQAAAPMTSLAQASSQTSAPSSSSTANILQTAEASTSAAPAAAEAPSSSSAPSKFKKQVNLWPRKRKGIIWPA